jgi:hypothetical protein
MDADSLDRVHGTQIGADSLTQVQDADYADLAVRRLANKDYGTRIITDPTPENPGGVLLTVR